MRLSSEGEEGRRGARTKLCVVADTPALRGFQSLCAGARNRKSGRQLFPRPRHLGANG
jgi:hypothetical protein